MEIYDIVACSDFHLVYFGYIFQNVCNFFQGKHPNTYTFTKSIAEYIVEQNSTVVPSAIVRPSIGEYFCFENLLKIASIGQIILKKFSQPILIQVITLQNKQVLRYIKR